MFHKISICVTILLTVLLCTQAAFAGSINSNEQRVIDEGSGYFYFEGNSYTVPASYLNELKAYLARDEIDLTAEQADEAIFIMHKNVATAVSEGYVHKTKKKAAEEEQSRETVEETSAPAALLEQGASPLNLVYIAIGTVLLLYIGFCFARYKRRGLRYSMIAIFAVIICSGLLAVGNPLDQNFILPMKSAVEQGNPENLDLLLRDGISYPKSGDRYATLSCDEIGLMVPVYYGVSADILKNGGGQSEGSYIGISGRVVIDGYSTTYFEPLKHLTESDLITITTSYGVFTYRLADDEAKGDLLVLNPQNPMDRDKNGRKSIVCSKVSGPVIEVSK